MASEVKLSKSFLRGLVARIESLERGDNIVPGHGIRKDRKGKQGVILSIDTTVLPKGKQP